MRLDLLGDWGWDLDFLILFGLFLNYEVESWGCCDCDGFSGLDESMGIRYHYLAVRSNEN